MDCKPAGDARGTLHTLVSNTRDGSVRYPSLQDHSQSNSHLLMALPPSSAFRRTPADLTPLGGFHSATHPAPLSTAHRLHCGSGHMLCTLQLCQATHHYPRHHPKRGGLAWCFGVCRDTAALLTGKLTVRYRKLALSSLRCAMCTSRARAWQLEYKR